MAVMMQVPNVRKMYGDSICARCDVTSSVTNIMKLRLSFGRNKKIISSQFPPQSSPFHPPPPPSPQNSQWIHVVAQLNQLLDKIWHSAKDLAHQISQNVGGCGDCSCRILLCAGCIGRCAFRPSLWRIRCFAAAASWGGGEKRRENNCGKWKSRVSSHPLTVWVRQRRLKLP